MTSVTRDDRLAAWRALLLAHSAVVRAIESDLARERLIPLTWYDVLLELDAAPDRRLRMSELGERVVLSRSRVSRLVDELERLGYVERTPDERDGRASLATLTAAGRAALKRTAPRYVDGIERHFTSLLTDRERGAVAAALGKVAEHHRP